MRSTVVAAIGADGQKAPSLIIHKGNNTIKITRQAGLVLTTFQKKTWVNSELLIRFVVDFHLILIFYWIYLTPVLHTFL
jgi:hypothetical protein